MQLRELELHGFKTFAGRTRFQFSEGVTAIVGPNGSGKSNLADAVRWILGEQRASSLRARRSEDMIFGGTERRARMGVAEGFMILDNSSGLLPIAFSEIVVGRRIYRNGESEYLLNGSRVRLRDIQELLAHAGIGASSYTVIGQGLVDAALSLRAEERRQLFEDAAGLGAYQGKRADALRRLERTQEHLTRVRDILAEIEPRMRRLQRQAERAEEYVGLKSTLHDLLRQFYGYRWGEAARALAESQGTLVRVRERLQSASVEVATVERELHVLRARQAELRDVLQESRRARGALRAEAERLRRESAVAVEREHGFARQQEAVRAELQALEAEGEELERRVGQAAAEGARLRGTREEAATALTQAQAELDEAQGKRAALRRELEETRRASGKLTARERELLLRETALVEREQELARERAAHEEALSAIGGRLEQRLADARAVESEMALMRQQHEELEGERRANLAEERRAVAAREEAQQALREVERLLAEVVTRRDLLSRIRAEATGYGSAVRALVGARGDFGETLIGPVADHLRVPVGVSTAVSAALGTVLHAVVTREGADRLRAWLHERELGRAMLLPLPSLQSGEPREVPVGEGIVGRGSELVQSDERELLAYLLDDWLVLSDWQALDALDGQGREWNLVTLDGQVRRRDGAIVAGRGDSADTSLLEQSREWTELPAQVEAVEQEQQSAKAVLDAATQRAEGLRRQLVERERALHESDRQRQRAVAALQRERRDAEKLEQEQQWRRGLVLKLEREVAALRDQAGTIGMDLATTGAERERLETRLRDLEARLEETEPGLLRVAVEQARTRMAVLDEQLAGWKRARADLDEAQARLERRRSARAEQVARLDEEERLLGERVATLKSQVEEAERALAASVNEARPLEQEQARNEEKLAELDGLHVARRQRRQEIEEQAHRAQMALQSADERLDHLREQIETDLGMVEIDDEAEGLVHQSLLPIDELVTSLPRVAELPQGLENDVRRLRRRIGYLGVINPDAPAEYAELRERFTFLTEQAADLQSASHDLRNIVAELDELMRERFLTTLHEIDLAFRGYFTRLFNGGQARLELTDPDEWSTTGVEVVARAPGKRSQNISLLSGGERALTAAALIFAILKVSPSPFCVLDEVDAMLDEANIGRFRDVLVELARETQLIVVTHNRGTIEAARAIYGISQSDPGISEVISMRLDEAVQVAKQ